MSYLNHAIVKHNLWDDDEDLPRDFSVGGYAAAGKYKKKGENDYKERSYSGAGVGHIYEDGAEAKGPNAAAGFEKTKDSVKGAAQAEVCGGSVSHGDFKSGVGALKAGAGYKVDQYGVKAGAEAELLSSSMSYGPVGLKTDIFKGDAEFRLEPTRLKAKVGAKVVEFTAKAGRVKAKTGVSADTGLNIDEGLEVEVLGTGVRIGREIGFSVLGTGFSIELW